jgi:hypothetical protein
MGRLPKRCFHCQGPFGLTRQVDGFKQFCTQRCKDAWKAEEAAKRTEYRSWLAAVARAP